MAMKQEESTYRSALDLGSIRQVLRAALGRKVEISSIEFDALDVRPDLAILAEKKSLFGADSAMHVYIDEQGDHRRITLVALGSGVGDYLMSGIRGSIKLSGGREMASQIVEALRREDSSLQEVQ